MSSPPTAPVATHIRTEVAAYSPVKPKNKFEPWVKTRRGDGFQLDPGIAG